MEETSSIDFRKIFLLAFTRELILHSLNKDVIKLQEIVRLKEPRPVSVIQKIPIQIGAKKIFTPIPSTMPGRKMIPQPIRQIRRRVNVQTRQITRPGSLYIPEQNLPAHLEYLKPIATNREIDLGKLNPLIKDPAVKIIEVNPEEKVRIVGTMGARATGIIMSKEDVDGIIDRFSIASKIPTEEGIYKVVVGKLILSAIISEVIGSRFIIRKIIPQINQQYSIPQRVPIRTVIRKETIIKRM